jgi:hypothetical protein
MIPLRPNGNTFSTRTAHPQRRIDYLYTNWGPMVGTRGEVQSLIASDHFPVEYDL